MYFRCFLPMLFLFLSGLNSFGNESDTLEAYGDLVYLENTKTYFFIVEDKDAEKKSIPLVLTKEQEELLAKNLSEFARIKGQLAWVSEESQEVTSQRLWLKADEIEIIARKKMAEFKGNNFSFKEKGPRLPPEIAKKDNKLFSDKVHTGIVLAGGAVLAVSLGPIALIPTGLVALYSLFHDEGLQENLKKKKK